jgi:hypothetical protein
MPTDSSDHRPIRRLLRQLIKAPAVWSLVWPMVLLIGSYIAYSRWYRDYLHSQYHAIDPANIEISDPHRYIRVDLAEEVYQNTRLSELSPLDRQTTAKVASAFASHPWVKHVHSVRKLPAGRIQVDLEYRRPVAVFHATGDAAWLKRIEDHLRSLNYSVEGGADQLYFPLDGEGVLLPTDHMTLEDTRDLIHIEVREVFPTGNKGTPFGDRRVESAALLARLLAAVRDQVKIAKITVSGDPRMNRIPLLEVVTGDGTHLFWGSPPGMEQPNERTAKEKLTDLLAGRYVPDGDLRFARQNAAPIR